MDYDTLAANFDIQVVAGDILAPDAAGAMQVLGKLVNGEVVLSEVGVLLTAEITAEPAPQSRRRRKAPSDPVPTGEPSPEAVTETPEPAPEPVDQGLSLVVSSEASTADTTA